MNYRIIRANLFPLIEEEVSREAAIAYSDNVSLYDGIIISSADKDTINRLEDDAVNTLVKRLADVAVFVPADEYNEDIPAEIHFDVPDFDSSFGTLVKEEITRYIVLNVCAAWFQSRHASKVEEYTNRGQVALEKVVALLKTRKPLRRI